MFINEIEGFGGGLTIVSAIGYLQYKSFLDLPMSMWMRYCCKKIHALAFCVLSVFPLTEALVRAASVQ